MMKRNAWGASSTRLTVLILLDAMLAIAAPEYVVAGQQQPSERNEGRRLFGKETFGGNGRTKPPDRIHLMFSLPAMRRREHALANGANSGQCSLVNQSTASFWVCIVK